MMNNKWPSKDTRELFEIDRFIIYYRKLAHGRDFGVVEKRERPDYILIDTVSKEHFGIELTSAYINNRSVPDIHMKPVHEIAEIPYDLKETDQYKQQLIKIISEKIQKAKAGYDTSSPLILSIYVNEYISIHLEEEGWEALVKENERLFDQMSPFCEVVFWPLPNESIFSVKPSSNQ